MSKTTDNGLKRAEKTRSNRLNLSDFLCLTPFSGIFRNYPWVINDACFIK
jgi:hypothetical protein